MPFVRDVVHNHARPVYPLTTFEYDEWAIPTIAATSITCFRIPPTITSKLEALSQHSGDHITPGLQVQYWEPAKRVAKLARQR